MGVVFIVEKLFYSPIILRFHVAKRYVLSHVAFTKNLSICFDIQGTQYLAVH
jgi:hypothetical protein